MPRSKCPECRKPLFRCVCDHRRPHCKACKTTLREAVPDGLCGFCRWELYGRNAQAQLGHSSIATTAIYARGLGVDEAFDAIADRPMPGVAR